MVATVGIQIHVTQTCSLFLEGQKTFWEKKEKMLVTSIFLFSPCVFKSLLLQVIKSQNYTAKG